MPQKNKIKMLSTSTTHFLEGAGVQVTTTIPEKGETTLAVTQVSEGDPEIVTGESIELSIEGWENVCAFIAGAIEQLEEAQNEDDGNDD